MKFSKNILSTKQIKSTRSLRTVKSTRFHKWINISTKKKPRLKIEYLGFNISLGIDSAYGCMPRRLFRG